GHPVPSRDRRVGVVVVGVRDRVVVAVPVLVLDHRDAVQRHGETVVGGVGLAHLEGRVDLHRGSVGRGGVAGGVGRGEAHGVGAVVDPGELGAVDAIRTGRGRHAAGEGAVAEQGGLDTRDLDVVG